MEKPRGWEGLSRGDDQAGRRRWSETGPRATNASACSGCRRGEVTNVEVRDTLVVVGVAVGV